MSDWQAGIDYPEDVVTDAAERERERVLVALRRVLEPKTTPGLIDVIVEDVREELAR